MLTKILTSPGAIDWKGLCITRGTQCWILYVDALVLDSTGNIFDAVTIATKAALYDTQYGFTFYDCFRYVHTIQLYIKLVKQYFQITKNNTCRK